MYSENMKKERKNNMNKMNYALENGEEINITVEEKDGNAMISIDGKSLEVKVNGGSVYKNLSKPYMNFIFPELQAFVEKHEYTSYLNFQKLDNGCSLYLILQGLEFLAEFFTVGKTKKVMRLVESLTNYQFVAEDYDIDLEHWKNKFETLQNEAKVHGFTFFESHGRNEYDSYHALDVPVENFTEEKVLDFIKKWQDYNDELGKVIDN